MRERGAQDAVEAGSIRAENRGSTYSDASAKYNLPGVWAIGTSEYAVRVASLTLLAECAISQGAAKLGLVESSGRQRDAWLTDLRP